MECGLWRGVRVKRGVSAVRCGVPHSVKCAARVWRQARGKRSGVQNGQQRMNPAQQTITGPHVHNPIFPNTTITPEPSAPPPSGGGVSHTASLLSPGAGWKNIAAGKKRALFSQPLYNFPASGFGQLEKQSSWRGKKESSETLNPNPNPNPLTLNPNSNANLKP